MNPIIMSRLSFVFLVVVLMFFGCKQKISNEQFEQEVLSEIFLKVVDSTYTDKRIYTNFPKSGEAIYDHNGNWIGNDTVGQYKRDIAHKVEMEVLRSDTLDLIIAVGEGGLINDTTDLEKYNNRKFIFKHLSELPLVSEYENWTVKYPKFTGVLVFSNIKFDVNREHGVLEVGYYCGGKCGLGYKVTIEKVDHRWVISKVEDTWIS